MALNMLIQANVQKEAECVGQGKVVRMGLSPQLLNFTVHLGDEAIVS